MSNKTKLLNCPFCGGEGNFYSFYHFGQNIYFTCVKCKFCGAQARLIRSAEDPKLCDYENGSSAEAMDAWNERQIDEDEEFFTFSQEEADE